MPWTWIVVKHLKGSLVVGLQLNFNALSDGRWWSWWVWLHTKCTKEISFFNWQRPPLHLLNNTDTGLLQRSSCSVNLLSIYFQSLPTVMWHDVSIDPLTFVALQAYLPVSFNRQQLISREQTPKESAIIYFSLFVNFSPSFNHCIWGITLCILTNYLTCALVHRHQNNKNQEINFLST